MFWKVQVSKSLFRANWLSYTKDSLIFIDLRNMNSSKCHYQHANNCLRNSPATIYWGLTHTLLGIWHIFSHLFSQEIERKETEVHFKWGKGLLPRPTFWVLGFSYNTFFSEKGKNWFSFSDKCADSETFCHSASISSLQRDRLKNSWVIRTIEQAFWAQIRKGSLQLSIMLEIRTDSSDTTEMTKQQQ